MMPADEHVSLSTLELLLRERNTLSPEQEECVNVARRHLQSCQQCSGLEEMYVGLMSENPQPAFTTNCPAPETWLEYAAGLMSGAEAETLLTHAASCRNCAAALKIALEDMGADHYDEALQNLGSSGASWQEALAARLSEEMGKPAVAPVKAAKLLSFPRRSIFVAASIAAMMLVAVSLVGWNAHLNSDNVLLAKAYDAQRRTALRLPGGDAVPMASVNRGASEDDLPTELLRVKVRAMEQSQKNPDDPHWHLVLGRVALVAGDGKRASREFEIAESSHPDLESTLGLADAAFEMGEVSGDNGKAPFYADAADRYGQAIDRLQAVTGQHETLALVYFNRALCWERLSIFYKAAQDYKQALAFEKDTAWREEIQRRLKALSELKEKSELNLNSNADFSAKAFLAAVQTAPDTAYRDYENYLGAAMNGWLASGDSVALQSLARIGLAHKDAWLRDLLSGPPNPIRNEAIGHLVKAAQANTHGDNDGMLREAQLAADLFRKAHNAPGELRANAETVYALQRTAQAERCSKSGTHLLQLGAADRYPWIHVYLLLETSACGFDHGSLDDSLKQLEQAISISRSTELPLQLLRAQGFMVSAYGGLGHTKAALTMSQEGLSQCAETHGARMPTYQFLHAMYQSAQAQNLRWTAAGIAEAASQASSFISNRPIQAYSYEVAGIAETKIDHYSAADVDFAHASQMLDSMPAGPAVNTYRTDWEADRSELLAHRGKLPLALATMRLASQSALATDNYLLKQKSYDEYAGLLLRSGDATQALRLCVMATQEAERQLATTTDEVQRLAWERNNGESYRTLVQSLVAMGRREDALRAWEWYRSAPFRTSERELLSGQSAADLPGLPLLPVSRRKALTIVIAQLGDRYVVWSVPPSEHGEIGMAVIAMTSDQIRTTGFTFRRLCSNRDSSTGVIKLIGARLYSNLFGSFQDQIERTSVVQLDLDPVLSLVPVSALVQPDGRYLGVEHPLVILPAWWSIRPPAINSVPSDPKALLVEGAASINDAVGGPSILAGEYLETRDIAKLYPHAQLLVGEEASAERVQKLMTSAELFHFSGHTAERNQEVGIVLSDRNAVFGARSLKGVSLKGCWLAVLATCSSAASASNDLEDTGSLTHALLVAGAGCVVGTLWDVDSRSSRELMLKFYKSVRQSVTPAEALRVARKGISEDAHMAHPFYWAAEEVFTQ